MKFNREHLRHPLARTHETLTAMREAGPRQVGRELVIFTRDRALLAGAMVASEFAMIAEHAPPAYPLLGGAVAVGTYLGSFGREFNHNIREAGEFWSRVAQEDEAWNSWHATQNLPVPAPRDPQTYNVHVHNPGVVRYTGSDDRRALHDLSSLSELTATDHPSSKSFLGFRRDYRFDDRTLQTDPRIMDGEIKMYHTEYRDGSLREKFLVATGIDHTPPYGEVTVERSIRYIHLRNWLGIEDEGVEAFETLTPRSGGELIRRAVSIEEVSDLQRKIFEALPPADIYG